MNLVRLLGRVAEVRLRALAMAIVAAIVAIVATFHVSLSPPRLTDPKLQVGVAQTELLVDTGHSPLALATAPLSRITSLGSNFALLANTSLVTNALASALHVPTDEIGVETHVALNVPRGSGQDQATESAVQVLATKKKYSVLLRNNNGSAIVQILTQAPDGRRATLMATTVADTLVRYVRRLAHQTHIPTQAQVVLHQLGPATGGTLGKGASTEAAVVVGIIVWILGMIAIVVQRRWSTTRQTIAPSASSS